jgi:hypothetical protein
LSHAVLDPDQAGLEAFDTRVREALDRLRAELEAAAAASETSGVDVDPEFVERFANTARSLSVQISNDLPPQLEPAAMAEIRRIIINILNDLEQLDAARPLDTIDKFFVGAEALRHIVRDALDEQLGCKGDDAPALVAYLQDALPRISRVDQARLVGISTRHLQRLAKDGGIPPRRLVLVCRLVRILGYAWTPEGVVAWFYRDRRDLDGHAPVDVLNEVGFEHMLLRLARQGRAEHGS